MYLHTLHSQLMQLMCNMRNMTTFSKPTSHAAMPLCQKSTPKAQDVTDSFKEARSEPVAVKVTRCHTSH